jgi:bifunctional DNase/RNase
MFYQAQPEMEFLEFPELLAHQVWITIFTKWHTTLLNVFIDD